MARQVLRAPVPDKKDQLQHRLQLQKNRVYLAGRLLVRNLSSVCQKQKHKPSSQLWSILTAAPFLILPWSSLQVLGSGCTNRVSSHHQFFPRGLGRDGCRFFQKEFWISQQMAWQKATSPKQNIVN